MKRMRERDFRVKIKIIKSDDFNLEKMFLTDYLYNEE